jgi:hypothetical protein
MLTDVAQAFIFYKMLPDALRRFQMLLEVSQMVSNARRCSQRFKMLSEALRASYAQGLYHSNICFSEMRRACTTARFAFPKCAGLVPQQDLLFRNAQGLYHSNICFSEMRRAYTTARFASQKCTGLVPQQHLLF